MVTTFEEFIHDYLREHYGENANRLFEQNYILQYIAYKTKSADRGAKSRASFANLYAIYVIVEDYLDKGFDKSGKYSLYEGAQYSKLLKRQRELPFGAKLQNHALNSRMNDEFFKLFQLQKQGGIPPIIRNLATQRYWFNENYLIFKVGRKKYNLAQDIINILNHYIQVKQQAFDQFIDQCKSFQTINPDEADIVIDFVISLLNPNVDARLFEITSYAILKFYYSGTEIYWGYSPERENLTREALHLYKTGRTNANDGGIDFVMKPLGRFFK